MHSPVVASQVLAVWQAVGGSQVTPSQLETAGGVLGVGTVERVWGCGADALGLAALVPACAVPAHHTHDGVGEVAAAAGPARPPTAGAGVVAGASAVVAAGALR
jgi:hypothetical protein